MSEPVSIVILAHNEVNVIESVIRDFYQKIVSKLPGSELIIAEDGSTDGTKEVLATLVKEFSALRWEEGEERRGYVNAFKQAMTLPHNELILYCDASGKHDPDDFWKMYDLIPQHDMVIGYKVNRADPAYRVALGHIFNFLVRQYFGVNFKDIDCPLRLFRKSAFAVVAKQEWLEKSLINFELTLRFQFAGYRITQVPVQHFPRAHGESRGLPLGKIPRVILNVLRNFPKLRKQQLSTLT